MRRLWRRVDLPSAAFAAPPRVMVLSMITLTVAILTGSLVGRPVKNGDAHLKHTATEKTAAVPVAEAEPTKVLLCGAVLATMKEHSRSPPGEVDIQVIYGLGDLILVLVAFQQPVELAR